MLELILGIFVGITIPFLLLLYLPNYSTKIIKQKPFEKKRSKNYLNEKQENIILKSFHQCRDVHWLNVFLSRFWIELSETNAQAYRFKSYIKKCLESTPTSKLIKEIDILEIDIGTDCPIIEHIEIVDSDQIEKLIQKSINNLGPVDVFSKQFDIYTEKENQKSKDSLIYEKIFKNVNAVASISFQGSMRIKMKVVFPKEISLNTNVYIKKLKGDIFIRFPSINYNTRLEYAFLSNPQIEIDVEAGVCKGEGEGYFKNSISNFLRRLIKYTISKTFVYPSLNTLYVPLLISTFKNCEHSIVEITVDQIKNLTEEEILKKLLKTKESLFMFLTMDYKIYKTFNGIFYRKNNFLLNNREKIICAHFTLPEKFDDYLLTDTICEYKFNDLSNRENIVINAIINLNILKNVISSFDHLEIIRKINSEFSLVLLQFNDKQFEFVRIITSDTIFFQKNDTENSEFLIFKIKDSELFVYSFTYNPVYQITKKRLIKLKSLFDKKPEKRFTVQKIYKASKNVFKFWKFSNEKNPTNNKKPDENDKNGFANDFDKICRLDEKINENLIMLEKDDARGTVNKIENLKLCEESMNIDLNTVVSKSSKTYSFKCEKNVLFSILSINELRLKFIYGNSVNISLINKKGNIFNMQVYDPENPKECNFVQSYFYGDLFVDVVDNKKVYYKLIEKSIETKQENSIDRSLKNRSVKNIYSLKSESENNLFTKRKKNQIYFKSENLSLEDNTNLNSKEMGIETIEKKLLKKETTLEIFFEECLKINNSSSFYESVFIRIKQHDYLKIVDNIGFDDIEIHKELKKDFFGNIGSVYLEFKTDNTEEFKFFLYSTLHKKNILEIAKVLTTKSFKLLIPIYEEDILLLRLLPKSKKNIKLFIKIVNLPIKFQNEALLDCQIGLGKHCVFTYPILGSVDRIIYWEKDIDEQIQGVLKNSCTKVSLIGSGTMRTDNMNYSIIYKNKGLKRKDIKLYMGYTTAK